MSIEMSASNQIIAIGAVKSGGGIEYADPTLHPKYNATSGKLRQGEGREKQNHHLFTMLREQPLIPLA